MDISLDQRFCGLLYCIKDESKWGGSLSEGEVFLKEEEVMKPAILESPIRHEEGLLLSASQYSPHWIIIARNKNNIAHKLNLRLCGSLRTENEGSDRG